MTGLNFKVDLDKCIHCGLCAKDCICGVIKVDEDNSPYVTNDINCIGCQHCMSICPVGAISIFDKNPETSDKILPQNPDLLLNLIKSRRSDRNYKQENVENSKIQKLKDMLQYIPTGCNFHALHFSFVEDIDVMNEFRTIVNNKLIKSLTTEPNQQAKSKFAPFAGGIIAGHDIIFRGAPHLLIVSNSEKAPCYKEDVIIALSYFELYAQSLGLGTCWCGLLQSCMEVFPELSKFMKIPEGFKSGYAILFGEKAVNYSRAIQPNPYVIESIKKTDLSVE